MNIICYDLETGGLDYNKNAVTQIAMIAINTQSLEEIGRFESIISPYNVPDGEPIYEPKALEYSRKTLDQIAAGNPLKEVVKGIMDLVKITKTKKKFGRGRPLLAGHNIKRFDQVFFEYMLSSCGEDYQKTFQDDCFDTLTLSMLKFASEETPNHKLGTVAEHLGINMSDAHDAMVDVEGNTDVIRSFIQSLRGTGGVMKQERIRDTFRM